MQKFLKAVAAIMIMVGMFFVIGCNKPDDPNNGGNNEVDDNDVIVMVTTTTPSEITSTTAKCGAEVTISEGVGLREVGVCWSIQPNPIASDNHLSTSNWVEPYVCTIKGLELDSTYHVRAYALCGLDYYYGEDKSFTTEIGNGTYNGHDYVDLGLPSGTLWATCNVGAETPEEFGDYFAWGETQPKEVYGVSTYKWCEWSIVDHHTRLTKYCNKASSGYNGFTDNLTILLPEDDAATANWGSGWRMPTKEQCQELLDNTSCIRTTQNDVVGFLFTASNGNSLFLPAAGYCEEDILGGASGIYGFYWSSSLYADNPFHAWYIYFITYCDIHDKGRALGKSVRAVRSVS